MFTGLVKEIGVIKSIIPNREGKIIEVTCTALLPEIAIDDSVSINGACQTVVEVRNTSFKVQAVQGTLDKTTLGRLKECEKVNLELALRLSDRLGGHLVQGHINGIGKISKIEKNGDNYVLYGRADELILKYLVKEGSIAIEGISLTLFDLTARGEFVVSVIPHTWFNTVLQFRGVGDEINIEVDILAKYIEKLVKGNSVNSGITAEWLSSKGF